MNKLTNEQVIAMQGNKIHLKPLALKDSKDYSDRLINMSIETKILTSTGVMFSHDKIEEYIENAIQNNSREDFLILENETTELIGDVVISDIDRRFRNCLLRIAIFDQDNFSKGYGQEALQIIVNYVFGMLNLHRIELEVLTENTRAKHVYKKIGFKEEGIKRDAYYFDHEYKDVMMMSILKNEFVT